MDSKWKMLDEIISNHYKCVAILAINKYNNVILSRQYIPRLDETIDELPRGDVCNNETPLASAKRELMEETGYESNKWIYLGNPREQVYNKSYRYAFLALNCIKVCSKVSSSVEIVEKSFDEFFLQLTKGECSDPEVGWLGLYKYKYIINNNFFGIAVLAGSNDLNYII